MVLRPIDQTILTLDGYMSDLRITKGVARYTDTFQIRSDFRFSQEDLLDSKCDQAVEDLMRAEDANWKSLGQALAEEISRNARRPGVMRRYILGG